MRYKTPSKRKSNWPDTIVNGKKVCSKCKILKDTGVFRKDSNSKSGFVSQCKQCKCGVTAPVKRAPYIDTQGKECSHCFNYQPFTEFHKDRTRPVGVSGFCKNCKSTAEGKGKQNAINQKRKAKKLKATPKWLSTSQEASIKKVYNDAACLRSIGYNVHVDHIIPLQNALVCGLHTPWNLRIISAKWNLIKSNNLPPEKEFTAL